MQLDLKKGSRTHQLAILTLIIMAVFVVRLFYLQVIRHDYYIGLADQEQLKQLVIPAKRGEIYAMDGGTPVKMVLNEAVYTVFADPKIVDQSKEIIDTIHQVAGGNAQPNLDTLLAKKESRYQILAKGVTRKQAEMMKSKQFKGLGFQEESQRVYPEGQLAAQTLGFVNNEGKGQYGVEEALNDRLKGKDGALQSVTDVSNVPLTIGNKNINTPAQNGENVVLTVDRNVQAHAEKALAEGLKKSHATNGSVMVMDPQSGKIVAMANLPTYNPAEYTKVTDAAAFNNATISAPYEPGSDVKTMTMAVGLDKGVVEPDSTYNNTDSIKIEDRTITNATKGQTGNITFQHAMNYSLNTGFVTVAERLGDGNNITRAARDTMYSYFHDKFRLGILSGIELAGEAQGTVIPPTDVDGGAVRYSNMAFGQGLDVTMLQACAAFSTIINGGTYYTPSVIAGDMSDDGGTFTAAAAKPSQQGVISKAASDKLRTMVHNARDAFYSGNDKKRYYIGGKTGTSQTIENGKYVDNQTVGTYLGFGGNSSDAPRYVIMVQVSGKGMNLAGNTDAMPIFTDISNWMLDYLKLQ
ncbi:MAG TPA: penicillin-binding protein 2, partial [Candidatus Saccharimonadales bacterium]|nr:penicillin-binding protein 2 [Candidatus Saccharimonadales bacterium]